MNSPGKLIVIEGIDGTGKSTQATMLAEALRKNGREVVQSFEPTDGPWGRKLRESGSTGRLTIEEELDFFLKDRAQHVQEVILPTIQRGGTVILDRYYFSSMAYQGARGIDPNTIRKKNEAFAPTPDILIILDLPVTAASTRIGIRDGATNEFEKRETLQFCRQLFLNLKDEPFSHIIDADASITDVHRQILKIIKEAL